MKRKQRWSGTPPSVPLDSTVTLTTPSAERIEEWVYKRPNIIIEASLVARVTQLLDTALVLPTFSSPSSNMSYPRTYRSWRRSATPYPLTLVSSTESLPETLGANDVLIRIHAVSLNYRDAAMLQENKYPVPVEIGGVSASDCAAEVVAIGSSVSSFALGDHVAPTVDLMSLTGDERTMDQVALGGNGPGTLREYAIFEEKVLVRLPTHLSWEEVCKTTLFYRSS